MTLELDTKFALSLFSQQLPDAALVITYAKAAQPELVLQAAPQSTGLAALL